MRSLKMTLHNDHIMVGEIKIHLSLSPTELPKTSIEAIDMIQFLLFQLVGERDLVEGDTVRLNECHWFGVYLPQITLVIRNGEADFSVQADKSGKRRLNAAQTQETINLALSTKSDCNAIRCRTSISDVVKWSVGSGQAFIGYFHHWSIKEASALWYAMQIQRN